MKVNITIAIPAWVDKIFAWPVMVYRKLKYGYTFRRIYLGDGLWTKVDSDVYYRLGHFKWYVSGNETKFYAARNKIIGRGKTKKVLLHREIMRSGKGRVIDHRNSDSFDNRRDNLRKATYAQNSYNRRKRRNTTSKYLGVSFDKQTKNWAVKIKYRDKHIWIGRFKNEIDAAKARDKAARKYHGRFANLNFPELNPETKKRKGKNTLLNRILTKATVFI